MLFRSVTKPNLRVIERSEKKLEGMIEGLVKTALETVEIVTITAEESA